MEAFKSMPFGAVWEELCRRDEVAVGVAWLKDLSACDTVIQSKRQTRAA